MSLSTKNNSVGGEIAVGGEGGEGQTKIRSHVKLEIESYFEEGPDQWRCFVDTATNQFPEMGLRQGFQQGARYNSNLQQMLTYLEYCPYRLLVGVHGVAMSRYQHDGPAGIYGRPMFKSLKTGRYASWSGLTTTTPNMSII